MKNLLRDSLTISFLFSIVVSINSCSVDESKKNKESKNTVISEYDSVRATELGADIYGMKNYVFAFLKKGPKVEIDSLKELALQKAHLENIYRMKDEGILVLAGPFLDQGEIRGIFIFNVETVEEARRLTETDPKIKSGILEMELKPWYGTAALLDINKIHKVIAQRNH